MLFWRLPLLKQVEIKLTPHQTLVIYRRGMPRKTAASTYPLERVEALRSFLAGHANTVNICGNSPRKRAVNPFYSPAAHLLVRTTFVHWARGNSESREILHLRTALNERWGFTDHGFQGKKWSGAAV